MVLSVWYAAIAMRVVGAARMNVRRFPFPFAYLALTSVKSIILARLWFRFDAYRQVYSFSVPIILLAESLAILGAFRAVTEKYPKFRTPGSIFLGVLALLGGSAAYLTRFVAVSPGWDGVWQSAALFQRSVLTGMIVTLIMVRALLPRLHGIPIRPSADRVATLMAMEVAVELAATTFAIATGHVYKVVDALIPVCGSLASGSLWAFWLPRASDECPDYVPLPDDVYEGIIAWCDQRERALWAGMRALREWLWSGEEF